MRWGVTDFVITGWIFCQMRWGGEGGRRRTIDSGSARLHREKHVRGLHFVLRGQLLDDRVLQQGRVIRAERRVCRHDDAFRKTVIDEVLLSAGTTGPRDNVEMH